MSLMQQHRARFEAEQAKKNSEAERVAQADTLVSAKHQLLFTQLETDVQALHHVAQGAARNESKANLLKNYMEHVTDYLESGQGHPYPPLVQCMIWAWDLRDLDLALMLSAICMTQKQTMPDGFERGLEVFVFDEYREAVEEQQKRGEAIDERFSSMFAQAVELDYADKAKAKWCKIAAKIHMDHEEWTAARDVAERGLAYDVNLPVKQIINRATKNLQADKSSV